jgi:hypothetical protein
MYKEIPITKYSEEKKLNLKLYTIIILGSIASGDDVQTQILINNGIVEFINELLKEPDLKVLKNAIWIAESICSGSIGQIACLYEKNTIYYIIQIGIIVYENIIKPDNDKIKNILLSQTFKSIINVICLSITQSLNNEVISVLNYENHVCLSLLVFAIKNYKNDFDFLLLIFQSFHTIKLIEEIIPDSVYLNNDFSYFSFMINNGLGKEIENLCNCPNDNVSREADYFYHTIILGDDDPDNALRNSFSVEMDENNDYRDYLRVASMMHDVGKLMIPIAILEKPGPLTDLEFQMMMTHTNYGDSLLSHSDGKIMDIARSIAYEHHERWDGKGYPRGLRGNQISIYAQIVSVADVYDALTSDRAYKEAWDPEEAKKEILRQSGKQFSPSVVDAFIGCYDKIEEIRRANADA